MRDDQIRDVLRTLEEDRVPDPAFADELHASLAGMSHRRARRWPLVLLAAAAVLALAGGAALGSGLMDPPVTAEATPNQSASIPPSAAATPSATASVAIPSPTASPSTDPATPEPTPTPDQATALGVPPGLLPPGAVVITTGDGVRIREEPSTRGEIVATMALGDAVYVEASIFAGPVSADGYDWYAVAYAGGEDIWPWQDVIPGDDYASGWMAAGSATERFVRLADVVCPTESITLSVLAFELTDWERLVCLRGSSFTIEGTFGCDGCGGVTPGASPTWLVDLTQHPPIAGQYRYYPFVRVAVPPDLTAPEDRGIVRATLHVDDPAAASCSYTPDPSSSPPPPVVDAVALEIFCRERLVLESFEVIGTDDFGQ